MSRRLNRPPGNLVFTTREDKNVTSTEVLPRNFAGSIVAKGSAIAISETVSVGSALSDATLLIGAGPITPSVTGLVNGFQGRIIAADGGAKTALELGLPPQQVIGDLDSLDRATVTALADTPILHDPDQDTTDFEKCLARIEAALILGIGFLGGRLDHSLAALSTLAGQSERDIILLSEKDIVFSVPETIRLNLEPGTRVSLFPMGSVRGASTGLHWPIDGLDLSPSGRVATSNRATGPVSISAKGPLMVILPLDGLKAARDGLRVARSGR